MLKLRKQTVKRMKNVDLLENYPFCLIWVFAINHYWISGYEIHVRNREHNINLWAIKPILHKERFPRTNYISFSTPFFQFRQNPLWRKLFLLVLKYQLLNNLSIYIPGLIIIINHQPHWVHCRTKASPNLSIQFNPLPGIKRKLPKQGI